MTEMQTKQNNGATQIDFNTIPQHLEALNHRLVELLGDDYAIRLDKPEDFELEGEPFIRYSNRCVYYTHGDDHYDEDPSGWIAVSQKDGHLISGCWAAACERPQIKKRPDGYQPAPTLLTLSRNDKRLLKTLLDFGCEEVTEVNGNEQIAVAFPVTYADGSQGFHYRVALEGKGKWLHQKGGKASQAVFGLYNPEIQTAIREAGYVVIVESPPDAAVLITARFPSISGCGKGNTTKALACDQHRQTLLDLVGDNGVVYVWVEPDAKDFAQKVANALQRPVKVIYPPDYAKDAFRLWLACGKDWDRFRGEIVRLTQNTTEIAPQPEQATKPQTNGRKVEIPETIFKRLSEIEMLEFDWLVDEYIPIGAVTLLAGEGGAGKSTLLCDLTAAILKGDKWLNKFEVEQGGVILIVTEGIEEIRSRLEGYGITSDDPLIVVDLNELEDYSAMKAVKALPAILQMAKERLEDIPIRLIGLDCLRGFGFDEKQASRQKGDRLPTVREIYKPLAEFAKEEGSAVIVTHHFRKPTADEKRQLYPKRKKGKEVAPNIDKQLLRSLIAGTADIVNAARHALVVVSNEEAGTAILAPVKSNRSQILGAPILYDWRTDAPTFLNFLDEDETVIEKAIALLRRELADGAKPSDELKEIARKEGISVRTLRRAKARLGIDHKTQVVNGEKVWVWFFPYKPDLQGNPPEDPQREPDPQGSTQTPSDSQKLGKVGKDSEKAQQNLEVSTLPNEAGLWQSWQGWERPDERKGCQVCQSQNSLAKTLANLESPINKGVSKQGCQLCQTLGNLEGNPPDQPAGDPKVTVAPPVSKPDPQATRPETAGSPPEPERPVGDPQATVEVWDYDRVYGDLPDDDSPQEAQSEGSPPEIPTLNEPEEIPQEAQTEPNLQANEPEGDPLNEEWLWDWLTPERPQSQSEVSPPEPEIEFIQINSNSAQPEPVNEPEVSPPTQPDATLNEPICPYCGIELEPDPESGLAACLGCGRLFKVETQPTSPDDDNPPETPDDSGQGGFAPPTKEPTGSPPNLSNNGRRVTGKEPEGSPTLSDPQSDWVKLPCAQAKSEVSPPEAPETLNRMTVRLPDGSVKLSWQRKTETVAPDDLKGWQPIETIPDIDLPNIESVEIPPVVVLDLETDGLDPAKWSISAAGLALYLNGKEVETLIIANKGNEADLLAQTFDYLRETCNKLGNVILTGYNIADFDLPYLIERARKLKVECPFRYLKDRETGEIKRWKVAATEGTLRGDPLDYPAIATDLPIKVIDTLHLVCRWDYTAKALRNYDLKSVAAYFNVNQPDRPILSPDQIRHAFQHDPKTFEAYLMADLRETYALFETHIKPYAGVAALTKLPIDQVATRSTAWVWEQILERHYKEIPQPDEKRKYEGGLVVSRKGLWFPCLKVDIASLYPTIMLAYRIHSRKDPDQIALRWLKTLTRQRLELKAKAKAGDANAQILQEAMKILLNSLYGFYGTGGYGFNDMGAAAKVTEVGRKVLTLMIEAVEDAGGLVVEADTDGLIICHANADPQQILNAITAAIPPVFKVEVEWQEAVCFVSDDKSYIVLPKEGDPIIKGSKWRGRDKEAYLTKAIPTFVRLWALEGKDAALAFALQTLNEIRTGQGWRWVVRSHRVGKGDKFLIDAGFKVGEIATYAYKDRKRKIVAKSETEGYDCGYYAKEFSDLVKEVIAAIDPAQIEAWERMVASEARPLIFATN
ncbi:MAG: AAA family ATPase [Armatimonadota bacterium]|jgi:hypothetical protein